MKGDRVNKSGIESEYFFTPFTLFTYSLAATTDNLGKGWR